MRNNYQASSTQKGIKQKQFANVKKVSRALERARILFQDVRSSDGGISSNECITKLAQSHNLPGIDSVQFEVETYLAVGGLLAAREQREEARKRAERAQTFVRRLVDNMESSILIVRDLSSEYELLMEMNFRLSPMYTSLVDDFKKRLSRRHHDHILTNFVADQAHTTMHLIATFKTIAMLLEPIAKELSDTKLIRSAADYRCASTLAWAWWEHAERYPTLTRNDAGREPKDAPKTAFQAFIEGVVPRPSINEGILRSVIDDLRFLTSYQITEQDARSLVSRVRKDRHQSTECARSLIISFQAHLGEKRRAKSAAKYPQT